MQRNPEDESIFVVSSRGLLEKRGRRNKLGAPRGRAHGCTWAARLAKQVVLCAIESQCGALGHKGSPPGELLGKDL